MKRIIVGVFVLLTFVVCQSVTFSQAGAPPNIAFDIPKSDIDLVLKNAPPSPPDRQLRVVDMGKYNLGVGIIHRGPTTSNLAPDLPMIITTTRPRPTSSHRDRASHNGRDDRQ